MMHIFIVLKNKLKKKLFKVMDLVDLFYKKFGFEYDHIELSTRPEKRIGR